MGICELWVRGQAENGGIVSIDLKLFSGWNEDAPMPSLTPLGTADFGRGPFTSYSLNPAWPYNGAGWYTTPDFYLKNCTGSSGGLLTPNQPHDCVNGNCLPRTVYKTPGLFASLAACQSGCAKNSNCTGECVDPAEIAALNQAISKLKSKICK